MSNLNENVPQDVPRDSADQQPNSESWNRGTSENVTRETSDAWFLDKGVAGTGPRPDFLESKYGSVMDQAKAVPELRKALGARAGAPEKYDFTKFQDKIEVNSPAFEKVINFAKENKFTQEGLDNIFESFIEYESSLMPDEEAELKKLGPDGPRILETLNLWAQNNLSPQTHHVFQMIPKTKDVIEAFDEMRQMVLRTSSNIPNTRTSELVERETKEQILAEWAANKSKYDTDQNYQKEIRKRLEIVLGPE